MSYTLVQFKHHVGQYYSLLCNLLTLELKYEVRAMLRRVFLRIGHEFSVSSETLPPS